MYRCALPGGGFCRHICVSKKIEDKIWHPINAMSCGRQVGMQVGMQNRNQMVSQNRNQMVIKGNKRVLEIIGGVFSLLWPKNKCNWFNEKGGRYDERKGVKNATHLSDLSLISAVFECPVFSLFSLRIGNIKGREKWWCSVKDKKCIYMVLRKGMVI